MADPLPLFPDHVRCATCRWWPAKPDDSDDGERRHCEAASYGALAVARERYWDEARLYTRSDFGCRLWEPRE